MWSTINTSLSLFQWRSRFQRVTEMFTMQKEQTTRNTTQGNILVYWMQYNFQEICEYSIMLVKDQWHQVDFKNQSITHLFVKEILRIKSNEKLDMNIAVIISENLNILIQNPDFPSIFSLVNTLWITVFEINGKSFLKSVRHFYYGPRC